MKFGDTRITRFVKGLGAAVGATALLAVAPVAASASVSPFLEATGSMKERRSQATAAPLPGGDVLVVGGGHYSGPKDHFGEALTSAETYDSTTGEFTLTTGSMAQRRESAVAVPLPGGKVLVAGGKNREGNPYATAEVFDPETGEFTATGAMTTSRTTAIGAPLPSGKVLIAGGNTKGNVRLSSAEIYDPETGKFSSTGSMSVARQAAAAAPLDNGTVLVAGGFDGTNYLSSAEIYNPSTGEFSATGSMPAAMIGDAGALADGTVTVFGYKVATPTERFVEEYDAASGTFSTSPLTPPERDDMAIASLPGGRLLMAGGTIPAPTSFEQVTAGAQILVSAPSATSPGVDFGPVEVSEPSAVETLTVTNDGAQTLEFEAAASLSGPNAADFTIVADGCETAVLAFGESCTVEVQVEPSALGARSASVQLPNNSATGLQEFALKAEGV